MIETLFWERALFLFCYFTKTSEARYSMLSQKQKFQVFRFLEKTKGGADLQYNS